LTKKPKVDSRLATLKPFGEMEKTDDEKERNLRSTVFWIGCENRGIKSQYCRLQIKDYRENTVLIHLNSQIWIITQKM
jgi:hypothetical protein